MPARDDDDPNPALGPDGLVPSSAEPRPMVPVVEVQRSVPTVPVVPQGPVAPPSAGPAPPPARRRWPWVALLVVLAALGGVVAGMVAGRGGDQDTGGVRSISDRSGDADDDRSSTSDSEPADTEHDGPALDGERDGDSEAVRVLGFDGMGAVRVGASAQELIDADLLGPLEPGCELGGPSDEVASLQIDGVEGYAHVYEGEVDAVVISSGAVIRPELELGMGYDEIQAASAGDFEVSLDTTYEEVFGWWLAEVHEEGGDGTIGLVVDPVSGVSQQAGVPYIPLCE